MSHEYDGCALSFGGGVNSVAMAILLVNEGWRGPVVFADTGCEWPETMSYMTMFERDWLAPRGLSITRLGAEWRGRTFAMSLIERCEQDSIVPGLTNRWCTGEWKRKPLHRWAATHGGPTLLVGIAADESHRSPDNERPLCDRHITRDRCKLIIDAEGLPVAPKSGCYLCMFQRPYQWRRLWERHPTLFERVARLDDTIWERRGFTILLGEKDKPLRLRDLARGFARQDRLPGLDLCDVQHLRCWACMT